MYLRYVVSLHFPAETKQSEDDRQSDEYQHDEKSLVLADQTAVAQLHEFRCLLVRRVKLPFGVGISQHRYLGLARCTSGSLQLCSSQRSRSRFLCIETHRTRTGFLRPLDQGKDSSVQTIMYRDIRYRIFSSPKRVDRERHG